MLFLNEPSLTALASPRSIDAARDLPLSTVSTD
jgi:hypothetical protein